MHSLDAGAGMLVADGSRGRRMTSDDMPDWARDMHLSSIGDHLQRIDGRLMGIKNRLTAVEQGVTDLRVAVTSLKGRVDALPTTLQIFGLGFGLLVGLPTLATIGVFVAR